ncbi:MAG: hypothetical protein ACFCVF_02285 [Kineosporiaceae bacterium]
MTGGLEIRGGDGGTAAAVEDLWTTGARLEVVADRLRDVAGRCATRLADPAVAAAAAGPAGGLVLTASRSALGPRGPGGAAVLLVATAAGLRATAGRYAATEAMITAAVAGAGWVGGRTGAWLPLLAFPVAASLLAAGPGPARPSARRWLAGPVGSAVVSGAVAVVPAGLRGVLGLPWVGADVPGVSRGLVVLAHPFGLLQEGDARLRPARRPAPAPERAPDGVADLLAATQRATATGPAGVAPEPGTVRVVEVRRERDDGRPGSAWIVHVPGTQEWAVESAAGGTPFDLTGNLHLMAGGRTAGTRAVTAAMTVAGVPPDEPVLLVGHSQGGLVAAAVAADPAVRRRFAVSHVVTAGSPVAAVGVPPDVRVLSLEHTDDLVAGLDGRPNPDRRTWLTVRAPAPSGTGGPLPPHDSSAYTVTAGLVDRSTDPDLVRFRRSLAPFRDGPGIRVRTVDVVAQRAGSAPNRTCGR